MEHVDVFPYAHILDAPVPHVEDHALEFFRRLDLPVADVPHDLLVFVSFAVLNEPQGGTVDGSADYFVSCPTPAADCRAARYHSCSAWLRCSSSLRFSPRTGFNSVFSRADRLEDSFQRMFRIQRNAWFVRGYSCCGSPRSFFAAPRSPALRAFWLCG